MARPLRVKRLDSPLARSDVVAVEPAAGAQEPAGAGTNAELAANGAGPRGPQAAAEPMEEPEESSTSTVADRLPPPPPLDEPLDFVSGRVPASLAQRLNAMTLALRQRQPTRASQKGLPQQEMLAVVLWALGDPDDAESVDGLAELHAQYRARRYATAAEQLGRPA